LVARFFLMNFQRQRDQAVNQRTKWNTGCFHNFGYMLIEVKPESYSPRSRKVCRLSFEEEITRAMREVPASGRLRPAKPEFFLICAGFNSPE